MGRDETISGMKDLLRREVARFCRGDDRHWKGPVVQTIRELREAGWRSVFFGGTLRSLLISRLWHRRPGRPRDIDIVIRDMEVPRIREQFKRHLARETRFGGLQLRRMDWQFDMWPLDRTWALVEDRTADPGFDDLPRTTFFNLEAVAVEVWSLRGHGRLIYSGDDQFFGGILDRVVEVNREDNPFPGLCVVRALLLASGLDFRIGPRLSRYISEHGTGLSPGHFEEIQAKHYGKVRQAGAIMRCWTRHVADASSDEVDRGVRLPILRQATFWPDGNLDPTYVDVEIRRGG